jgi:hypothetical protein
MKDKGVISGNLHKGDKQIKFTLPVIVFEEDGVKIVYCPALEVYG